MRHGTLRSLLPMVLWATATIVAAQDADPQPRLDAEGFLRAGPGRRLSFPADHGSHPETRTEWWYLTGTLEGPAGETFGFQATWFRRALRADQPSGRSPLAVRDVMLFHGALTDVARRTFEVTEEASRAYDPWARANEGRLEVAVLGHVLHDADGRGERARMTFGAGEARLELEVDLAAVRPLRHGAEPGLSIKGHEPGQASWYYSLPALPVSGRLTRTGEPPLPVTGSTWFDHEFGSSQLDVGQVGWDWFSTVLDDGTELMLYAMRLADGGRDTTSAGTLRRPGDDSVHLPAEAFTLRPTGTWTSRRTGTTYPSGWVLEVPGHGLRLEVEPLVPDQELVTDATGVTYWEGLCRFSGVRDGGAVSGRGYVELVGYGEPITDRFRPANEDSKRP